MDDFNASFFRRATGGGVGTRDQMVTTGVLLAAAAAASATWWYYKTVSKRAPRVGGEAPLGRTQLLSLLESTEKCASRALHAMASVSKLEVQTVVDQKKGSGSAIRRTFEYWYAEVEREQRRVLRDFRLTEEEAMDALRYWVGEGDSEVMEKVASIEAHRPALNPTLEELKRLREDCKERMARKVEALIAELQQDSSLEHNDIIRIVNPKMTELRDSARHEALQALGPGFVHSDRLLWISEAERFSAPWHADPDTIDRLAAVYDAAGITPFAQVLRARAANARRQQKERGRAAAAAAMRASNPMGMMMPGM